MRESIGSTFLYNMIIVFIVIVFAILAATLTYYKAFKVNTRIINSIEKFEGYNDLARNDIQNTLTTIGYMFKEDHKCSKTKKDGKLVGQLETEDPKFRYCVYFFDNDGDNKHYTYGVVTYITFDFPIVNRFLQVPIYTKSNHIYNFS